MASRTEKIIKNARISLVSKLCALIISFATRTIFVKYLGTFFLGVNGLYTEVIQILNFAELGFGAALTFALYAPVANCEEKKTIQLLALYRKIYKTIALVVVGFGLALIPFLQYIVQIPEGLTVSELRGFFLFFLANSVLSYLNAEKVSYLNALQRNYEATRIEIAANILIAVVQAVLILLFRNYAIYLAAQTVILVMSKLYLSCILKKKYPILVEKACEKMTKAEQGAILREVKNLAVHKFSSIAVHATDNIIISAFAESGILLVGLISNYNLLINSVLGFVVVAFNSLTAGFGNLVVTSGKDNYRRAFLDANFMNFWIYGFCSIAFFSLIPPFIELWLGKEYLIDNLSFFLIIVNCYLQGQTNVYNSARDAAGNFGKDSWVAFTQSITNLIVSIVLVRVMGLVGVYIGTVVSRTVYILLKPYRTYRFLFGRSVFEYYIKLLTYFASAVFAGMVTKLAINAVPSQTMIGFAEKMMVVAIVPNLLFFVLYFRSIEFKQLKIRVIAIIGRNKK